jgi:hypothetical protein
VEINTRKWVSYHVPSLSEPECNDNEKTIMPLQIAYLLTDLFVYLFLVYLTTHFGNSENIATDEGVVSE